MYYMDEYLQLRHCGIFPGFDLRVHVQLFLYRTAKYRPWSGGSLDVLFLEYRFRLLIAATLLAIPTRGVSI